jgi:hemolysin activation/secretion protein
VSVLRLNFEWERLERNQVFAARSLLSFGLPVLGARSSRVFPNGQFVAWLGQFQWARRFEPWGIQTIFRTDVQLSSDPLPTLEQIPVGGHASVRGYRENQLVRDQAVITSLELRLPVWRVEGRSIVELAPFFDFGYAANRDRPTPGPDTLASAGVGLRLSPHSSIEALLYWGYQIDDVSTSGDLQDDGIQFRVRWNAF